MSTEPKVIMRLTRRERNIVFGGGVTALVILSYSFIVDPILQSNRKISKEIEVKSLLISRFTSLRKSENSLKEEYRALNSDSGRLRSGLLASGSPSLAAADLQKFLNETAKLAGITIESEKVLEASRDDIFMVVPVEIVIKANLRKISKFLFELENGKKLLNVRYLKMKSSRKPSVLEEELIESKVVARGYYINGEKT